MNSRGLVAAYVLQPAHVPLDVHLRRGQRVEILVGTPVQEDSQVGVGMDAGPATVAAEEGGQRYAQDELIGWYDTGSRSRRGSHP